MPALTVIMDPVGLEEIARFLDAASTRAANRGVIAGIMARNFEPVVGAEKGAIHSISGALAASLEVRSLGHSRDKPGTISVFAAPTATTALLMETWRGPTARKQQRDWKLTPKLKQRQRVFYASFVELGHRTVRDGVQVGTVAPHPFASLAMGEIGDANAEAAAEQVLGLVLGN